MLAGEDVDIVVVRVDKNQRPTTFSKFHVAIHRDWRVVTLLHHDRDRGCTTVIIG